MALDKKFELIRPWIEGKKVLDLGCVDHSASIEHTTDWVHKRIKKVAEYVLGVDILENEIKKLKKRGYNVIVGDAQKLSLDGKFDVCFVGELIEHLTNFEGLLKSVHNSLKDDGILILTTPNVFSMNFFIYALLGRRTARKEHTCWFSWDTITNLLELYNFRVIEIKYCKTASINFKKGVKEFFGSLLAWMCENLLLTRIGCRDMVIIAKKC